MFLLFKGIYSDKIKEEYTNELLDGCQYEK